MAFRVAIAGIYHESNTFIGSATTLLHFKAGHWLKGNDIRKEYERSHHEIGGVFEIMDKEGIELIPVTFAEATPGGIISSETYDTLLHEMLEAVAKELPVDGFIAIAHGAAVSENYADMDGHWLTALRKKLGKEIPLLATLDPHANLSRLMVDATDGLIAYKTNPHIDQRETGRSIAKLMVKMLKKECQPVQHLVQMPLAISIEQQNTSLEPCSNIYELANKLSDEKEILSVSILLGFPYADVQEMGTSLLVIANNDPGAAAFVCNQLSAYIINKKSEFNGNKNNIDIVLPLIPNSQKPVLLLDMGDNIGAGSPGNSTFLMRALLKENNRFFVCLYDSGAVAKASKYQVGEYFNLHLEDESYNSSDSSYYVRLISLKDGKFSEDIPRHGGQTSFDMGKVAIVSIADKCTIMLTSLRIPPFSLKQLTAFGIEPRDFDVIIAKGVNAPIAAYQSVCPTIIQVNTPGVTQADMTLFNFRKRRKPMFPFEEFN